jgi:hypothetical protein
MIYDLSDMELESGKEATAVIADKEYQLQILEVTEGEDKNGLSYIMPRFEISGEPLSKDFTHFLHIPTKDMDAKKLNRVRFALNNFLKCFGIDVNGRINFMDQMPGKKGWAILGKKTDEQYGEQNFIKRFILPR